MVVARLLRMCGHGEHDAAKYISTETRDAYADCLTISEQQVIAENPSYNCEAARADILSEIKTIGDEIINEPDASPDNEDWIVYHSQASSDASSGASA